MPTAAEFNLAAVLLAIHWVPLVLAAWLWPLRLQISFGSLVLLVLSVASWLIVLIGLLVFTNVREVAATAGHAAGWYMIYGVLSLGLIPALVIAAHVLAGRFAGLLIRRYRSYRRYRRRAAA